MAPQHRAGWPARFVTSSRIKKQSGTIRTKDTATMAARQSASLPAGRSGDRSARPGRRGGRPAYNVGRGTVMRVGVLLGGCGLYDGSDVFETVLVIEALEAAGERALLLAPDRMQTRTIDHRTGDTMPGEERNVLRESARLGRGRV